MTASDIESVIKIIPNVGYDGNGVDQEYRGRETTAEFLARQKGEQEYLFNGSAMLSLIAVWCSAVKRVKTIEPYNTSYTYKHDVERNFRNYVANGQFITAAVFAGIRFKLIPESINVRFAMPKCGSRMRWLRDNIVITPKLPGEPAEWWSAVQGNTGEGLWRNVIASPGDSLARWVMADWLDENGLTHWGTWFRLIGQVARLIDERD